MYNDFYFVRDNAIPNNDEHNFLKYLTKLELCENKEIIVNKIEELMGECLYRNNIRFVASLNLLVRNMDIKYSKNKIIEHVYYAECRQEHHKGYKNGCLISFHSFRHI